MSLIFSLLNYFKPKQHLSTALRIVFHNQTSGLGMHGIMRASHVDHRIDEGEVRFTFIGLRKPPRLTPEVMNFIWAKAEEEGYVVHSIEKYAAVMEHVAAVSVTDVVSPSRLAAEKQAIQDQAPRKAAFLAHIPRPASLKA